MTRSGKRARWMRWVGVASLPLVIAASFLGLLIGIAGLCTGADGMAHPDTMTTLCVFFCGVITPTAAPVLALWIISAAFLQERYSVPLSSPAAIFHPPKVLAA